MRDRVPDSTASKGLGLAGSFLKGNRKVSWLSPLMGGGVGLLEGIFVLLLKYFLDGGGAADGLVRASSMVSGSALKWLASYPLAALIFLALARTAVQLLQTSLETSAVFDWVRRERGRLWRELQARQFPAYRNPLRRKLGETLLNDGKTARGLLGLFRCLSAFVQLTVFLPLLFILSWKTALLVAAFVPPTLLAMRLRARALAEAGEERRDSGSVAAGKVGEFCVGLECYAGNGRLTGQSVELENVLMDRDAGEAGWEASRLAFPHMMELFFFLLLAALASLAVNLGLWDAAAATSVLPFAFLLLLLYKPVREWAAHYPAYLAGAACRRDFQAQMAMVEAYNFIRAPLAHPGETIECRDLRFTYGSFSYDSHGTAGAEEGQGVFAGLSLGLDLNENTLIMGPNGAGKSTLLKLLARVEFPDTGQIIYSDRCLEMGVLSVAFLPQQPVLEPDFLTWCSYMRQRMPQEWSRLAAILGLAGMVEKLERLLPRNQNAGEGPGSWGALSGGEKQRLCLARVFASGKRLLLLDEPTSYLPGTERYRILEDLIDWRESTKGAFLTSEARYAKNRHGGIIMVSHEPRFFSLCHRVIDVGTVDSGFDSGINPEKDKIPHGMNGRGSGADA